MTHLAHALTAYHHREGSLQELLEVIDRMLTKEHVQATEILAELDDASSGPPLPADVIRTIKHRIELTSKQLNGQVSQEEETDTTLSDEDTVIEDWHQRDQKNSALQVAKPQLLAPNERQGKTTPDLLNDTALTEITGGYDNKPIKRGADTLDPSRETTFTGIKKEDDNKPVKRKGETLNDRFELIKRVGSGGMSTVYMAVDRSKQEPNDNNVAVKLLNQELANNLDNLETLKQEAQKSQSLNHPNIVEIYGFHRDGSNVYLTMEYLSGETLRDKIRQPGFVGMPLQEALPIINAAGTALAFAHKQGIIHCDFKPSNVFITDNNEIKVIDFGIARALQKGQEAEVSQHLASALTPAYASVEMLEHRALDQRDDIYALACTTYELLTGNHPFNRNRATEARDARLSPKEPQGLTNRQWQALQQALDFNRNSRTPTVSQFLTELNADKRRWQSAAAVAGGAIAAIIIGWSTALIYIQFLNGQQQTIAERSDLRQKTEKKNIDTSIPAKPTKHPAQLDPPERSTARAPAMEDKQWRNTQALKTTPDAARPIETSTNATQINELMMAAKENQVSVIKTLLETGEEINARDQHGKTALLWAVEKGHTEAVQLLAGNGAEVSVRNRAGDTVLMIAAWRGKQDIIKVLVNHGTEIDARNYEGHSALLYAAIKGHEKVLELLLEGGADPNITTYTGMTPLMAAARNGHLNIAQILLLSDSTVNARSEMGWTALMYAAWGGHGDIIEALVEHGANPSLRNNDNQTAAGVTARQGYKEIATFLEQAMLDK